MGFQFKPVLHVFAVIQTPMIQIPGDVIKFVEVVAIDASVVLPDKKGHHQKQFKATIHILRVVQIRQVSRGHTLMLRLSNYKRKRTFYNGKPALTVLGVFV